MPLVPLTKKRQVTIPAAWVAALGLQPGQPVWLTLDGDTIGIRRAPPSWTTYFAGHCPLADDAPAPADPEALRP